MSVGRISAARAIEQPKADSSLKAALPGVITGSVITAGTAVAMRAGLQIPIPLGLALGAVVGGPIIGVSLMNAKGKPNEMWQSLLVGAAPTAVAGGALGLFAAGLSGMGGMPIGPVAGMITGAVMLGGAGAIAAAITHAATNRN